MVQPPENTKEVGERHRFDEAGLLAWWRAHVGPAEALSVRKFRGGQSNPTFWIGDGERGWVLRKKPPGKLLPSAHAVEREHRVMAALAATDVPVPRVSELCEDASVIGTPFFVMEHVVGRILWNVQLPDLAAAERSAVYAELARVLAALHAVDVDAVGLGDYGRRGGYVARQVKRWSDQYDRSKTQEVPAMDRVMEHLRENVPANDETTLAHGDFRLDNLIFHAAEPRALALIDWELSTLGHPLADLAYTCMLYDVQLPKIGGLLGVDFAATGIPTEEAFVAAYVEASGRAVDPGDWAYFKAFGLFRLAAIAQGVYKRSLDGNASDPQAAMFGAAVPHLSGIAAKLLGIG
ncbi:MAG: phosphotransferase [Myxococcota bacterium]